MESVVLTLLRDSPLLTVPLKARPVKARSKVASKAENVLGTQASFCLPATSTAFILGLHPPTSPGDRILSELGKNLC